MVTIGGKPPPKDETEKTSVPVDSETEKTEQTKKSK